MRIGIIIILHKFLRTSVALTLLVGACSTESEPDDGLRVVATTSVVFDLVSNVVGDAATVEALIPIGTDPHEVQLSARQVAELREADLVVSIGLGLEAGLEDALEDAKADGVVVLELGVDLDPRRFPDGEPDPHVWLDPARMQEATMLIARSLAEIDPTTDWPANATAYAAQLAEADRQIFGLVSGLAFDQRSMVTNHDALGYFADRYGLDVVGVVIPGGSTLSDPSSAALAELVEVIDSTGVLAIFAETTESDRLAQSIASETSGSVQVVELLTGSLAEPGMAGDTLISMLLVDAERIVAALGADD